MGDLRSGQIGVLAGSLLFLLIVYFCEPWDDAQRCSADCSRVGLHWVVLTLVFEGNFGHYVIGRSWESIAAEYNLSHGGLLLVGLAIFAMTPWIALRLRRVSAND